MQRLLNEIQVLGRCQSQHGLPVADVVAQLAADFARPNGPTPQRPKWKSFKWPPDEEILDFRPYWKQIDGK